MDAYFLNVGNEVAFRNFKNEVVREWCPLKAHPLYIIMC